MRKIFLIILILSVMGTNSWGETKTKYQLKGALRGITSIREDQRMTALENSLMERPDRSDVQAMLDAKNLEQILNNTIPNGKIGGNSGGDSGASLCDFPNGEKGRYAVIFIHGAGSEKFNAKEWKMAEDAFFYFNLTHESCYDLYHYYWDSGDSFLGECRAFFTGLSPREQIQDFSIFVKRILAKAGPDWVYRRVNIIGHSAGGVLASLATHRHLGFEKQAPVCTDSASSPILGLGYTEQGFLAFCDEYIWGIPETFLGSVVSYPGPYQYNHSEPWTASIVYHTDQFEWERNCQPLPFNPRWTGRGIPNVDNAGYKYETHWHGHGINSLEPYDHNQEIPFVVHEALERCYYEVKERCGDGVVQNPPEQCEDDSHCEDNEYCASPGSDYECRCLLKPIEENTPCEDCPFYDCDGYCLRPNEHCERIGGGCQCVKDEFCGDGIVNGDEECERPGTLIIVGSVWCLYPPPQEAPLFQACDLECKWGESWSGCNFPEPDPEVFGGDGGGVVYWFDKGGPATGYSDLNINIRQMTLHPNSSGKMIME